MITRLLFERALLLFLILASLEFVLLFVWGRRRSRATARAGVVGLFATVVLPIVSMLVVTQAERIEATCQSAARAIDLGDLHQFAGFLDDGFHVESLDREEFLKRVKSTLARLRIDYIRLRGFEVGFPTDSTAFATFDASCAVRSTDFEVNGVPTRWRVDFRRRGDQWMITEVHSIPVPPYQLRTADNWLR